jgi:hypothetical protein
MKCYEPTLDEMFADGAVRQLMAKDGVSEAALRALLGELRENRKGVPANVANCSSIAC